MHLLKRNAFSTYKNWNLKTNNIKGIFKTHCLLFLAIEKLAA